MSLTVEDSGPGGGALLSVSWRRQGARGTRNITITTGLVDAYSTATLMRLVTGGHIDARRFITHRFALDEFDEAYDVFARAGETGALKVVLRRAR
jgi:threonine dehydrogenase-like Zn-dependent dehydrogenase